MVMMMVMMVVMRSRGSRRCPDSTRGCGRRSEIQSRRGPILRLRDYTDNIVLWLVPMMVVAKKYGQFKEALVTEKKVFLLMSMVVMMVNMSRPPTTTSRGNIPLPNSILPFRFGLFILRSTPSFASSRPGAGSRLL